MKNYDVEFAIIGTGFGGIIASLELQKNNFQSIMMFEKASEIGGTWRDNVYPGCACDVSSYLYSIHDEPNPDWSNMFSSQKEILAYLKNIVAKNKLNEKIKFDTEVVKIEFENQEQVWNLFDQNKNVFKAKYVLLAQGPLNRAVIPQFKGLENFKGTYFHTSHWDTSHVLKNKKVAVIGTGASAIQVIPNIVDEVAHLNILQRSAAWILPRANPKISDFTKKIYRLFPVLEKLKREQLYWMNELFGLAFVGNETVNKFVTNFAINYLKKKVPNEALQKKLIPTYKLGCKRVLVSKKYYPVFSKPNVSLITDSIKEIKEHTIVFENNEEIEVDTLIMATGFEAAEIQVKTKIIGIDGINLIDQWKTTSVHAFKGCMTHNYPNLFFILGPNTGLGHNSVVHMMESQMIYILKHIKESNKLNEHQLLNIKKEVEEKYNNNLQSNLKNTVWSSGCKSWYLDSKGVNTTIYPKLNNQFRKEMRKYDLNDFEIIQNI
jgi:cation diffusion facilitator CzcD-associated flavoprotein CzcO